MIELLHNWLSSRGSIGLGADVMDFLASVLAGALAIWLWFRARIHRDYGRLHVLGEATRKEHERVDRVKQDWLETVADFRLANYRRHEFMDRLPDRAIAEVLRPLEDGGSEAAATLEQWWASEREAIAEINGQLGEWYALFAIDSSLFLHAAGIQQNRDQARALALRHLLIAAQANPSRSEWTALAEELETDQALQKIEAGDVPALSFHLPAGLSKEEARLQAEAMNDLAYRRLREGAFWDAYLLADRASLIAARNLSENDPLVFIINFCKAQALSFSGHSARALAIAQPTWEAERAHPDLGARHPSTLSSANLVASILNHLGRYEDALAIAQPTWEEQCAHPDLGKRHPNTLASAHQVASILNHLGRYEDALAIAQP
ncbi:MAG: tetratricopeptide repeat protein, partial [Rhodomicrobium sp.]